MRPLSEMKPVIILLCSFVVLIGSVLFYIGPQSKDIFGEEVGKIITIIYFFICAMFILNSTAVQQIFLKTSN